MRRRDMERKIVQIKRMTDEVNNPQYQTDGAAGFDLESRERVTDHPGKLKLVGTGIKVAMHDDVMMDIRPRSGLALKYPNYIANSPDTIDPDYRGEIKGAIINNSNQNWEIKIGDRIAQGVLVPFIKGWLLPVYELSETDRGEGGHGSTGI